MVERMIRYLSDSDYRFLANRAYGLNKNLSDEVFLKKLFKIKMGCDLNLENPVTYNEKLQWLKIHDRNPIYTSMVDKYEVKKIVAEAVGESYVIPTLGVWDTFDEIDLENLPRQFVLKCTHDSGSTVICKDKSSWNVNEARKKINSFLRKNYYYYSREWPYKNVQPRILAEKYMEDNSTAELRDYKFFTFDGVAKAMFIASERQDTSTETKFDFYDMEFNRLNIVNGHPNSGKEMKKPETFDEMRTLAETLSKGIPHLRVGFYEVNGKVYFGEFTFSHWGGIVPFVPEEWDYTFGEWLKLPDLRD